MNKTISLMWTLMILTSLFSIYGGGDHSGEEKAEVDTSAKTYLPFYYLDQGNYSGALFFAFIWFLLIKGIWELTLLFIGRAI